MAVVEGAYNPLPAPPLMQVGNLVTFDGVPVTPDGAYLFDNNLVTMAGYHNTFPNFIVGWPFGVFSNYEAQYEDPPNPDGTPDPRDVFSFI